MRHKTIAIILLCVSVALGLTAVALGFMTWGGGIGTAEESVQTMQAAALPTESEQLPDPTVTPEPTAAPTPEPTATPWPGPLVPEQDAPMGADYFADAGFLGNSVTSGLWLYNNEQLLPTDASHWHWADSLTILGASPYAAQMSGQTFGKIYMGFGINEVNYDKTALRAAFNTVIDQLQNDHPDAIIYLMSVTPVSAWCDANRSFKRSAVQAFNDMLRDIAREQQVWYLDVYPALCNEDGFLPSDVTPDGVHFNGAWYQRWFDYMKTHYVPDGHTQPLPVEEIAPAEDAAETPVG